MSDNDFVRKNGLRRSADDCPRFLRQVNGSQERAGVIEKGEPRRIGGTNDEGGIAEQGKTRRLSFDGTGKDGSLPIADGLRRNVAKVGSRLPVWAIPSVFLVESELNDDHRETASEQGNAKRPE